MKTKSINIFSNIAFYIISLFLWLLLTVNLSAQSGKENELKNLESELLLNETRLLNLTEELQSKVELINSEKAKEGYDKDEVKKMMSSTAKLTNEIEKLQIERDNLTKDYNLLKTELYKIYSGKIDSVKNSRVHGNEKNNIITRLIEKRLYVSPKIDILSFEPEKVLGIDPSKEKNDNQIYRDFLTSAEEEIDTKLSDIKELKTEISTIISLNKETKAFLEEAEFDNDISYFTSASEGGRSTESLSYDGRLGEGVQNSIKTQTDTFAEILAQLDYNDIPENRTYSLDNIVTNRNIEEFNKLLLDVEQQLQDYKAVINNKLKKQ